MKSLLVVSSWGLLVSTAFFMACAGLGSARREPAARTELACSREVDQAVSGSAVEVPVGGSLCVTLESNPGTGYSWIAEDMDVRLLTQTSISRAVDGGGDGSGGTPGEVDTFIYHFEPLAPGQTVLRMAYRRIGVQDSPAAATFEITVNIAPAE